MTSAVMTVKNHKDGASMVSIISRNPTPAMYNAGMELRQRVQQLYNFIYGLIRTFRTLIQYVYKTKLGCFYVTAILG